MIKFLRVYSFKYLGVVLDPCLSWNDHVDLIASKISSRLGMLQKVIPRDGCITLYNSMVFPIFDYCSCIWDGCSQSKKEYLDRLQGVLPLSLRAGRLVRMNYIILSLGLIFKSIEISKNVCLCTNV